MIAFPPHEASKVQELSDKAPLWRERALLLEQLAETASVAEALAELRKERIQQLETTHVVKNGLIVALLATVVVAFSTR